MRTPLLSSAESPDLCRHDPAYEQQQVTQKRMVLGVTFFGVGMGLFLVALGWFY